LPGILPVEIPSLGSDKDNLKNVVDGGFEFE